jgi:hypothetical protein
MVLGIGVERPGKVASLKQKPVRERFRGAAVAANRAPVIDQQPELRPGAGARQKEQIARLHTQTARQEPHQEAERRGEGQAATGSPGIVPDLRVAPPGGNSSGPPPAG